MLARVAGGCGVTIHHTSSFFYRPPVQGGPAARPPQPSLVNELKVCEKCDATGLQRTKESDAKLDEEDR
jgi:hypothetical protein